MREEYTEKDFQKIVDFLKIKRFLDVKSDMVGKTLFRRNNVLLIDFLNDVLFSGLGIKVIEAVCIDPELGAEGRSRETGPETGKRVKICILDLLARITWTDENEVVPPGGSPALRQGLVNIEMQRKREQSFCDRVFNYAGRVMTFSVYAGGSWQHTVPVWTVAICESSPFGLEEEGGHLETSSMRRDRAPHLVVTEILRGLFMILSEFKKGVQSLKVGADFWCFFMKHSDTLTVRRCRVLWDKGGIKMRRALMALLDVSTDDALVAWVAASAERRANQEESDQLWRESEAEKKGWIKGKVEGKAETAIELLSRGFAPALVCEVTKLKKREVSKLAKEIAETKLASGKRSGGEV